MHPAAFDDRAEAPAADEYEEDTDRTGKADRVGEVDGGCREGVGDREEGGRAEDGSEADDSDQGLVRAEDRPAVAEEEVLQGNAATTR